MTGRQGRRAAEAPPPCAALRILVTAALCGVVLAVAGAAFVGADRGGDPSLLSCHTCHM